MLRTSEFKSQAMWCVQGGLPMCSGAGGLGPELPPPQLQPTGFRARPPRLLLLLQPARVLREHCQGDEPAAHRAVRWEGGFVHHGSQSLREGIRRMSLYCRVQCPSLHRDPSNAVQHPNTRLGHVSGRSRSSPLPCVLFWGKKLCDATCIPGHGGARPGVPIQVSRSRYCFEGCFSLPFCTLSSLTDICLYCNKLCFSHHCLPFLISVLIITKKGIFFLFIIGREGCFRAKMGLRAECHCLIFSLSVSYSQSSSLWILPLTAASTHKGTEFTILHLRVELSNSPFIFYQQKKLLQNVLLESFWNSGYVRRVER